MPVLLIFVFTRPSARCRRPGEKEKGKTITLCIAHGPGCGKRSGSTSFCKSGTWRAWASRTHFGRCWGGLGHVSGTFGRGFGCPGDVLGDPWTTTRLRMPTWSAKSGQGAQLGGVNSATDRNLEASSPPRGATWSSNGTNTGPKCMQTEPRLRKSASQK